MSRTVRNRYPLRFGRPYWWDRDHHCHCLGCIGQPRAEYLAAVGESQVKPSDRRRLQAAEDAVASVT